MSPPSNDRAAEWHGLERARLEALGRTPPFVDGQIAAVAAVNDLGLVTSGQQNFGLRRGLGFEDWSSG